MERRVVLVGEAPLERGAPPFRPGSKARANLAAVMGVPAEALDRLVVLRNAVAEPQPRSGWGRRLDERAARAGIAALRLGGVLSNADVVFLSWRLAQVARQVLPAVPHQRGLWRACPGGTRAAWVRHPCCVRAELSDLAQDWAGLDLPRA